MNEDQKKIIEAQRLDEVAQNDLIAAALLNLLAQTFHGDTVAKGFWDCEACDGKGTLIKRVWNMEGGQTAELVCPVCAGSKKDRNQGESLALIHSEVSEALEVLRGDPEKRHLCSKCNGVGVFLDSGEYKPGDIRPSNWRECKKCKGTCEAIAGDQLTEELADVVLRVFDFSAAHGLDIGRAIMEKAAYNRKRGKKHGKQF